MPLDDVQPPSGTFGVAIIADDIRQEVDGKITIVGAYGPDILVNADFPVQLPKLAFLVRLFLDPRTSPETLNLNVTLPGEETPTFDVNFDTPVGFFDEAKESDFRKRTGITPSKVTFQINFITPGIILKKEGRISVIASLGQERIRIPAAMVKRAPKSD